MISIAIVEDEKKCSDTVKEFLDRFKDSQKDGIDFGVAVFFDAVSFLQNYKPSHYDLVFLDIMMPLMDGMRAAEKLREIDKSVLIIFITNMGDYAVKGYDVNATAFIKKPLYYSDFELKLKRAVQTIKTRDDCHIIISSGTSEIKLMVRDLMYIDVYGHNCTFHMSDGRNITGRNTLSALAQKLGKYGFVMCSNSYLVNMRYINLIDGNTVTVGNDELLISRMKRKAFMQSFNEWAAKDGRN